MASSAASSRAAASRPSASAATAVGQMSKHQAQLKQLLEEALG